jgi:antitoxin component YwqK of YwqJK toxin-antitoxin module
MKNLFLFILLYINHTSLFSQSKPNNFTDSNGLKQKTWITYYKNGRIKIIANYKNDSLNGKYKSFFSNGKIEFESKFIMGVKDGLSLYYNKDGSISSKIINKLGSRVVFIEYWKGKVSYKEVYKNDTLIERWFDGLKQDIPIYHQNQ